MLKKEIFQNGFESPNTPGLNLLLGQKFAFSSVSTSHTFLGICLPTPLLKPTFALREK